MTTHKGGRIEQIEMQIGTNSKDSKKCVHSETRDAEREGGDTHVTGVTEKMSAGGRRGAAAAASKRPDAVRAAAVGERL